MLRADGELLATCNQLLIHVSLETRRSCDPAPHVLAKIDALGEAQAKLPQPESMR
jgi:carnitine 3-dehydrogenase